MSAGPPSKTDRIASWCLDGPLATIVLLLCACQLATWIPHLLTWPLFVDHDVFETMARGWDHGVLPYRVSRGNNFPGTIYLFWMVGKVFGWGRTWPVMALDSIFVIAFGGALLRWSWLRSGRLLPGAVGFASFLSYYLAADYMLVFQRDWHGPLFMMLALMVADGRRAWRGRLAVSALCVAIAFTIRPQVVLLIPAVLSCFFRGDEGEWRKFGKAAVASIAWLALVGGLVALMFLPVALGGIFPDFVEGVRLVTYGGSYNQATWLRVLQVAAIQAMHLEFLVVPAAILALLPGTPPRLRVSAWTCLIALAGAWCYRPVSPVPWPYLSHPYHVVLAVAVAMLVQMILALESASSAIRLVLVLFVLIGSGVTARPKYCSVQLSLRALGDLRRGGLAERMPIGYGPEDGPDVVPYPWEDYRDVLRYLREQTPPDAKVANLLRDPPALTGPSDRTSALPAESLAWLVVAPREEADFLKAIEQGDRATLVVWSPAEEHDRESLRLAPAIKRLAPAIRRYYEPRARFGRIEVWTRRSGDPLP